MFAYLRGSGYTGSLDYMFFNYLDRAGFNTANGYPTIEERINAWQDSLYLNIADVPSLHYNFQNSSLETARVAGPALSFTRATEARYFDSAGVLQTAASGTARFGVHYWNDSAWVNGGYLAEGARTNEIIQSEDLTDAAYSLVRTTINADADTAPDGITSADEILETAVTNTFHVDQDVNAVAAGETWVFSVFVKQLNNDYVELEVVDNGVPLLAYGIFRFSTEAFTTTTGVAGSGVEKIGTTGWYRIWISFTATAGATLATIRIWTNTDGTHRQSYAGNTSNGVKAWGLDVEEGAFPSSYIPTTTAAVMRNADNLGGNDATWMNVNGGVFQCKWRRDHIATGTEVCFRVESETQPNDAPLFQIQTGSSNGQAAIQPRTAAEGFQAEICNADAAEVAGTPHNVVAAYATNDLAIVGQGGTVENAPITLTMETGYSEFSIGDADGSSPFFGFIKEIKYWGKRKSNTEIDSLSGE